MLVQKYPRENLRILSKAAYHPYPTVHEREPWKALDPIQQAYWLKRGEVALNYKWPSLLATRFLDYVRDGNRSRYQNIQRERRSKVLDLLLAECMEGAGRFLDQLVNGLWLILEESYWGVPAHLRMQAAGNGLPDTAEPTVDLFAAETSTLVAMVDYLMGDQLDTVSPLIRPRIEREVDYRILTPNLERKDFSWMGYHSHRNRRPNNWNPWICSNWLNSIFLIEPNDERRLDSICKVLEVLDMFLDPYPRDGGCDEGPSYWNRAAGTVYDCFELLEWGTDGQFNMWDNPLIQEMGKFIYRVQIADDWMVNFADAPAVVYPDSAVLYRYGQAINDPDFMALGVWSAHQQKRITLSGSGVNVIKQSIMREIRFIFAHKEIASAEAYQPLPCDTYLPDIEVVVARDEARSTKGFCISAKGGNNNESHNHNDIGHFVVFLDGDPVLIDVGVGEYTAATFGPNRYDIWTMRSDYHNLPTVGGVVQADGNQFKAENVTYYADDEKASFKLDIARSYPSDSGIKSWVRTITLQRGENVQVDDAYELEAAVPSIQYTLMTASAVDLNQDGMIKLSARDLPDGRQAGTAWIIYDSALFSASVESLPVDDSRMTPIWGSEVFRITLNADNPPQAGSWSIEVTCQRDGSVSRTTPLG